MLRALMVLAALAGCVAGGAGGAGAAGPWFPAGQETAVREAAGGDATLECRVLRLADRTVSWVRARDLRILAHAGAVFTGDARVAAASRPAAPPAAPASLHTLSIHSLRAADAGRYECQLNTEPKMSLFFDLTVLDEAEAAVMVRAWAEGGGGGDSEAASEAQEVRVVRVAGGAVTLVCEARGGRGAGGAPHVRWLLAGQPVGSQGEGEAGGADGVWVETQRWEREGRAVSRVTLAPVRAAHAGRYSCTAPHTAPRLTPRSADIVLHVAQPAEMEAMQRDQSSESGAPSGAPSGAGSGAGSRAGLALALAACWARVRG